MKVFSKFVGLIFFALLMPSIAKADVLLVDDFDDTSKPNFLGGDFGAWDKDPRDQTQFCADSFDSDVRKGDSGYSLKLDYDVDSPNPAYNGFWMSLNDVDLRRYNSVVFHVAGSKKEGYTSQFKVEIKGQDGEIGNYLVRGITSSWKKIVVPFRKFAGIQDWSKIREFVIVFDDVYATDKDGVIYIDDVSFQTL
ncbi:hypothetical protein AB834_04145 [PVC group bacterium (ex Bugula neritina AB1)]|nr:hypothetical protein AB834_04145 [PVC group bacterium (ex Bugula neritina AB1)]